MGNQNVSVGNNKIGIASRPELLKTTSTHSGVRNDRIETEARLSKILCSTNLDMGITSHQQQEQIHDHFKGLSCQVNNASSLIDLTGTKGLDTLREADELLRIDEEIRRLEEVRKVRQANLILRRQRKEKRGQERLRR